MKTTTTGERIRALRTQKGMSQEELANRVGLKKAAINKYETGVVVNLKRSVIAKLADVLETSPAYLMGWEYDEKDTSEEMLALMESFSYERMSGRDGAKESMLKTFGTKHGTNLLRIIGEKCVLMYYHAFPDNLSAEAISALLTKFEKLSASDIERMQLLIEAYTAADARARQIVDLTLDPFLSPELKDWVGSLVPEEQDFFNP